MELYGKLKSGKSFVHLFSVQRNAFGLNSVEFLSLILFHPPSHFITVLTARIESPNRKELKTHKTFHSPTPDFLSRELGQIEI